MNKRKSLGLTWVTRDSVIVLELENVSAETRSIRNIDLAIQK